MLHDENLICDFNNNTYMTNETCYKNCPVPHTDCKFAEFEVKDIEITADGIASPEVLMICKKKNELLPPTTCKDCLERAPTTSMGVPQKTDILQKFLEEIRKHKNFWGSMEIKSIIGKTNKTNVLLALEVYLHAKERQLHDEFPCLECITKKHYNTNVEKIEELVNGLIQGKIRLNDMDVEIRGFKIKNFDSNNSNKCEKRRLTSDINHYHDGAVIYLRGNGETVSKLVDEEKINSELERHGFSGGLYNVSQKFLTNPIGASTNTSIYFIAPLYVSVDGEFKRNEEGLLTDSISIRVRCHKTVTIDDLKVFSDFAPGKPIQLHHAPQPATKDESFVVYEGIISKVSLKTSGDIWVYYKDQRLDTKYVKSEIEERIKKEKEIEEYQRAGIKQINYENG